MDVREYRAYDGLGLAALIRRGEVSREEVSAAARAAIEADNPALGAVVRTRFEQAAGEGRAIESAAPFAGVPTLTKDLLMAISGEPLTFGSAAMADWRAPEDSTLVRRLREAGLVILGQTATPELDPEVRRAVEQAARRLAALGHHLEWADPPVEGGALADSYLTKMRDMPRIFIAGKDSAGAVGAL